jgi:hypothetical protein
MKIAVDIDQTICLTEGNDYVNSIPIVENIAKINKLFDEGNEITYYTARGGTSKLNLYSLTLNQLNLWGCKFHGIRMDKPGYDLFIDDRSKRIEEL